MRVRPQRGFTLVEVLVALFVVALGMGALLATLSSAAGTTAQLREKTLAQWIALNRISELRLQATAPATGRAEGDLDYAGARWHWTQQLEDAGVAGLRRIEVRVRHSSADTQAALATAIGFLGTSVAAPRGSTPDWSLSSLAVRGAAPAAAPTPAPFVPADPAEQRR